MNAPKYLDNFEKTLAQLKSFCSLPIQNDRDKAGIIQAFEFTFEQSWLAIQKKAGGLGLTVASPRHAFSAALSNRWIRSSDEPQWVKMIEDRNLTSHTYKEALANEVLSRIQSQYLPLFESLLGELKSK